MGSLDSTGLVPLLTLSVIELELVCGVEGSGPNGLHKGEVRGGVVTWVSVAVVIVIGAKIEVDVEDVGVVSCVPNIPIPVVPSGVLVPAKREDIVEATSEAVDLLNWEVGSDTTSSGLSTAISILVFSEDSVSGFGSGVGMRGV